MSEMTYSFPRYLAAKKTVDDRALNRVVWDTLARALPGAAPAAPLRVLEVGAGIGTMIERVIDWGLLRFADYTALDAERENIQAASQRLPDWAAERGLAVERPRSDSLVLNGPEQRVQVQLDAIDLFDFIARTRGREKWDLLVAHAFLDLMDIPATLPLLFSLLERGGIFYFSINFDGATLLEPVLDPPLDEQIQVLFHRTMDERIHGGSPSGDSRAGRHLFKYLRAAGAQILSAGASDWVVFPGAQDYPADEAYFLHFIVETIHRALQGHSELDAARFADWIAERHAQVEQGELVYIAHQLDFVGKVL